MKILLLHNRYRIRGGEDSVFETEAALLREAGHEVVLWEKSNDDLDEKAGVLGKLRLFFCTIWSRASYRELCDRLDRDRPDVVHVHNFFPRFSPSVFHACARKRVPAVLTLHNYRLACLTGYLYRDGAGVCEDCLGRCPCRGILRRCYRGSLAASLALGVMLIVHRALGTWRTKVDRFVALTDFSRDKLVRAGIPADRIVVKPNPVCVDDDAVAPADRPTTARFAYVGRLSSEKGVHVLLRAWNLLRADTALPSDARAELVVVGDGPERAALESAAGEGGARDRFPVRFLGALPHDRAMAEVRASSALVLPSVCYETFGLAVVEAAAAGVPAIVSDRGAPASLVRDGETGVRFRLGDEAALAAVLREAIVSPERTAAMGGAARAAYLAGDFRPERNLRALEALYKELLRNPSAS